MTDKQEQARSGATAVAEIGSSIKVTPAEPRKGEAGERHPYWVGALNDCPLDAPTIGGIAFVKEKRTFKKNSRGQWVASGSVPGDIVNLSDTQVKEAVGSIANTVIRIVVNEDGVMKQAHKLSNQSASYMALPRDTPIAQFIYMTKAPNGKRGHELPETMYAPGVDD